MMSAGAVAQAGTIEIIGLKNIASRNQHSDGEGREAGASALLDAARAFDKVVTVDVPSTAPAVVPIASDMSAWLALGRRPFSSSILARLETPTSVPTVSKKSTKKKASVTLQKAGCASIEKSIFMNIGESDGGMETIPSGIFATPSGIASAVTDDDADEYSALYAARLKRDHEQQAEYGQQRGDVAAELAEAEEDGGIVYDDAGALKADECDEEPDTSRDTYLERLGIELTTSSRTLVQSAR